MRTRVLSVASLLLVAMAAVPSPAGETCLNLQGTLSVSPDTLLAGDEATIQFSNPAMAGQKITITITSGDPARPETQTIRITLDEDGKGSAQWDVPSWNSALFSAPSAADVRQLIF
jgi:hypothetical protein